MSTDTKPPIQPHAPPARRERRDRLTVTPPDEAIDLATCQALLPENAQLYHEDDDGKELILDRQRGRRFLEVRIGIFLREFVVGAKAMKAEVEKEARIKELRGRLEAVKINAKRDAEELAKLESDDPDRRHHESSTD